MSEKVIIKTKQDLRNSVLTLLRNQKEEERLKKSLSIQNKLFKLPEFKRSSNVFFYLSFDGEVDTWEMIKQAQTIGKKIGLPKIIQKLRQIVPLLIGPLGHDLEEGPYGVKQPIDHGTNGLALKEIDLIVVPGVAFDKANNRLGRGGGYYDRFLKRLPSHIPTIGLAFDFQICDIIPHLSDHDVRMTRVLVN